MDWLAMKMMTDLTTQIVTQPLIQTVVMTGTRALNGQISRVE